MERAQGISFLIVSQVMLMLPDHEPHLEKRGSGIVAPSPGKP